jgi:PPP family 3-phenylpropionic acid transporter
LFAVGALGGIVRWTVLGMTDNFWLILLVQPLHALTFGIAHLAAIGFIARAVPAQIATSAQSLMATLSMGLFLGGSIWASGPIFESIGSKTYLLMVIFSALSFIFALWLRRRWQEGQTIPI